MKLKAAIQVAEWLNEDVSNQAKVQHSFSGAEDSLKTIQNKVQGMLWGLISIPPRLKPSNSGATTQKNRLKNDILAIISSTL